MYRMVQREVQNRGIPSPTTPLELHAHMSGVVETSRVRTVVEDDDQGCFIEPRRDDAHFVQAVSSHLVTRCQQQAHSGEEAFLLEMDDIQRGTSPCH